MKKTTLIILLLTSVFGFSQDDKYSTENIAEAEMKSASKTMNMTVNSNTLNYDVTYHNLELTVNPAVYFISGKITTTFTALSNMNSITFDFANELTASSVKQGAANLSFLENGNNELVINLPTTLTTGNSATIEIIYSGAPPVSGFSAFAAETHGGSNTPVMWTLSEPYGARDWWPCKQDLNDKITSVDIRVTAPSTYKVAANGLEQSRTINGANATTHFRHNYPIPAYLIAFAVTNYQIYNQQGGLGTAESPFFPIVNYIYPESAISTIPSLAVTPNIINFYETIIGNYPFRNEKYGHAEFGWGGGMEHTTVSFMGGWSRSLIAHEMAHQWFGDKITCGSWKDIWLNEGITEYMSGLVVENFDVPTNPSAFITWKNNKINNITSATNGNLYLYDSQLPDVGRIFSSRLTYNKGSMVTNMLRFKMGDTNFFQGLRNYLSDPALAYAYALTPQFQAHMEAVSGTPGSLQEFFNDWVYNEGYPTYTINAFNSGAGQATVQISQTQSHASVSYFEMPVPVRLTGSSGQQLDVVLNNTTNGQSFVVPVGFTVTGVLFDPNKDIISRNSTATLGLENFNYDAAVKMYPNPASGILNIDLPANMILKKVSLYNTLGQKSLETNQNKIDVSSLSTGLYIVKFETSEGTFHKNFIKK